MLQSLLEVPVIAAALAVGAAIACTLWSLRRVDTGVGRMRNRPFSAAQRLESLQHFVRSSLDSAPEAILVTNAQGEITLANLAAAARFDVGQPDRLLGRAVDPLLAAHLPSIERELPAIAGADMVQAFALETHEEAAEGDWLVKGVPHKRSDGQLQGWIVTLVDIAPVRAAARRRDEALRFISHDIRVPQSAILTLIELRRGKQLTLAEADETLGRIGGLVRQSLTLSEDFLHLTRAETGIYMYELANLADLLLDAADQMWDASRAAQIRIVTELPDDTALFPVERSLMTRALVNLLGNAIKFSARQSEVVCSLRREGAWWTLCVRDQGIGIEPHEIPTLFQRFRRLNSQGRSHPDGAGLGLTFVKAVITHHKGQIDVSSAVGHGTEFRIRLPVSDKPVPDAES